MPRKALTGTQWKTYKQASKTGRKSLKEIEASLKPGANLKQYEQAYGLANQMLQPQAQEMKRQFQQEEAPQLIANLGVGAGAKSSSALNQALAASLTNLNHRLTGQTQQLAAQLAEGDLNRRMQAAQYGGNAGMNAMNTQVYQPKSGQPGFGKQLIGGAIEGVSKVIGGALGGAGEVWGRKLLGQFSPSETATTQIGSTNQM